MNPVTIRKSIWGLLAIFFRGLGLILALLGTTYLIIHYSGPSPFLYMFILVAAFVGIGTLVVAWVYQASNLTYTDKQLNIVEQITLFASESNNCDFADVQEIRAIQGGIFAYIFSYGTIVVATSGPQANLDFTYCPKPRAVRDELIKLSTGL